MSQSLEELAKQHNVSAAELEVALAKVLAQTPTKVQDYWLITDASDSFQTVIAERDIVKPFGSSGNKTDDLVIQAYIDTSQPWYSKINPQSDVVKRCTVTKLTHNEWVDWVRS